MLLLSHDAADLRQLAAAVDAANFVGTGDHGFDGLPLLSEDLDEIRQVVLLLDVLRRDTPDRVEQPAKREGVDAGVDLADLAFGRRGVLLLDYARNLLAGSDDPAITVRVLDPGGHDRGGGAGRIMTFAQAHERAGGQQRHVAR